MPELEIVSGNPSRPDIPVRQRSKLRLGFGLCAAALAVDLLSVLGIHAAGLFAASSYVEWYQAHDQDVNRFTQIVEIAMEAMLIAGLVFLYLAASNERWRRTGALLLAMAGVDVAIIGFRVAGAQPETLALANRLGEALGWIELWMLAVLAADAAEAIERSDITYQTEAVGRLIIGGGFVWLAWFIWSLPLSSMREPAAAADSFALAPMLSLAANVFLLVALARTAFCCGGLAVAYSAARDHRPPGQPA